MELMLYEKNICRNTDYQSYNSSHSNTAAMLAAILKKQALELGTNLERILYAENPADRRKIKLWSATISNIADKLAAFRPSNLYTAMNHRYLWIVSEEQPRI